MATKLVLPPANGLCSACLQDRKQTGSNGILIVSYCLHNQAGAAMEIKDGKPSGIWKIYTPISAEDFANAVSGAIIDIEKITAEFKSDGKIKTFKN